MFFKTLDWVDHVLFKFVNHVNESVSNVSFVSFVFSFIQMQSLFVIILRSLIILSPFIRDILGLGELVECFHSFIIEQVSVNGEFINWTFYLRELNFLSSMFLDDSNDIFSEHFNNSQSFIMFLERFDEHGVGHTTLLGQLNSLLLQIHSSVFDPNQEFSGSVDFII